MTRDRAREQAPKRADASTPPQRADADRGTSLLSDAGNRAVTRALAPPTSARGPGAPLPDEVRARFERSFGLPLHRVRVHRNATDVDAMNARAVTEGSSIAFAPGEYAPGSAPGQELLAHEVAHVVQQSSATRVDPSVSHAPLEAQARSAADAFTAGDSVTVSSPTAVPAVQAQTKDPPNPLAGDDKYVIEMPWGDPRATDKRPLEDQLANPPKRNRPQGTGSLSELGYLRDQSYFWKEYARRWPQHLSTDNQKRIANGAAPVVDGTWLKYYPQHNGYLKDTLEHHHTGQGSRAVGKPEKLHDAYTAHHPQRTDMSGGTVAPDKPSALRERQLAETARHTKEGRIKGEGIDKKTPPKQPAVPPSSELTSVPEDKRRPVDPKTERVLGETRHPAAKYTPGEGAKVQSNKPYQHELALEGEVQQRRPATQPAPAVEKAKTTSSNQLELPLEKPKASAKGGGKETPGGTGGGQRALAGPGPGRGSVAPTPLVHMPSARATAAQAGAQLLAMYVGVGLQRLNEYGIQKRINEEIEAREAAIDAYRDANIDDGVLLVLRIAAPDPRTPRPNEAIPMRQLVAVSEQRGGRTQDDAIVRWQSEPKYLQGAGPGMIDEAPGFVWIPPRRAVRPDDWIGGNFRSEGVTHYLHVEFAPQGQASLKVSDYTDGELFDVTGVSWKIELDDSSRAIVQGSGIKSISFDATLTKRSAGITSKSRFTVVDQNTLEETYDIAGYRGKRVWQKAPF